DRSLGLNFVFAVPRGYQAQQRTLQVFDDVRRQSASTVEPLVDDGGFLSDLSEEVAVEVGIAAKRRVRHVDVSHGAIRHWIDFAPVVFDPGQIPQPSLAGYRHNGNLA